jgi:hypothetical protein
MSQPSSSNEPLEISVPDSQNVAFATERPVRAVDGGKKRRRGNVWEGVAILRCTGDRDDDDEDAKATIEQMLT